eukprot:3432024-Pyramimonas_sp.AAC.1
MGANQLSRRRLKPLRCLPLDLRNGIDLVARLREPIPKGRAGGAPDETPDWGNRRPPTCRCQILTR